MRYGRETKVYTKEFAEAYANGLGPTVNKQLIASANMIADFWYTAWVNAGKPVLTLREEVFLDCLARMVRIICPLIGRMR